MKQKMNKLILGIVAAGALLASVAVMPAYAKRLGLGFFDAVLITAASGETRGVSVSSSTTSGAALSLVGAFQTLPTSGYAKGSLAYQLSDNTLYVATQTVVIAQSWKAAY